jgi:hypothetical protein
VYLDNYSLLGCDTMHFGRLFTNISAESPSSIFRVQEEAQHGKNGTDTGKRRATSGA